MEARASFSGASVSKTFVAAILIIVALGLAAMGGYAAKGLTGSGGDSLLGGLQAVGAVGDVLANPQIGGEGSFGSPSVGGGPVGGVVGGVLGGGLLGSLLSGGTGLLGGIF